MSFNDRPEKASRPYDKGRDGFVMGEGAGVVVLEEYEHAKARGAKIYAEVVGYGLSGDAYHVTAPHPEGTGADLAMRMALKKAGLEPSRHRLYQRPRHLDDGRHDRACRGQAACSATICAALSMSSTKSAIGHLLGGAGRGREHLLHPRDPRPDRPADAQPRQSRRGHRRRRPRPAHRQEAQRQGGAQQQLRLWRDQCQPGDEGGRLARAAPLRLRRGAVWGCSSAAALTGCCGRAPGRTPGPHRVVVAEGSSLAKVADQLVASGRGPGQRDDLSRDGANFRLGRPGPGRRIRNPQGHGRRGGARPAPARPAGPAPADHRPRECRRSSSRERLAAVKELTGAVPAAAEGAILPDSYSYQRGETRAAVLGRMTDGDGQGARRAVGQAQADDGGQDRRRRRSSSPRSSRRKPARPPSGGWSRASIRTGCASA